MTLSSAPCTIEHMRKCGLGKKLTFPSMFEHFTHPARKAMALARKEAQRLKNDFVGTEHILLELLSESPEVFMAIGVDVGTLRRELRRRVCEGKSIGNIEGLPFTRSARKALERAMDEANQLGHGFIGPEHLILGLLREQEGVAFEVLRELCVELKGARLKLLRPLDLGEQRLRHSQSARLL